MIPKTMKAAVLHKFGAPLSIEEVPKTVAVKTQPSNIYYRLCAMLLLGLLTASSAQAQQGSFSVEAQLKKAVAERQLHFPVLTQKLYGDREYRAVWADTRSSNKLLWAATDLIKRSPYYGLNTEDYHPKQLSGTLMKDLALSSIASPGYKGLLDVLVTDAMLSMVSHLHYGKKNPRFTAKLIDNEMAGDLNPALALLSALESTDFTTAILNSQPAYSGYKLLQQFLQSKISDDQTLSPDTKRLIALNLERWRWLTPVNEPYVHINIPAFQLKYLEGNNMHEFKVIVGKPQNPTPVLTSKIGYFTTSPDWTVPKNIAVKELLPKAIRNPDYLENNNFRVYDKKGNTIPVTVENLKMIRSNFSSYTIKQSPGCDNALGQIVFYFENPFSVYLHDTPDRSLFNRDDRALSHGCIRVDKPEKLVALFLEQDKAAQKIAVVHSAMRSYKRSRTSFKNPIPIMISYLTCEVRDGALIVYKDLYNRDGSLQNSLVETAR